MATRGLGPASASRRRRKVAAAVGWPRSDIFRARDCDARTRLGVRGASAPPGGAAVGWPRSDIFRARDRDARTRLGVSGASAPPDGAAVERRSRTVRLMRLGTDARYWRQCLAAAASLCRGYAFCGGRAGAVPATVVASATATAAAPSSSLLNYFRAAARRHLFRRSLSRVVLCPLRRRGASDSDGLIAPTSLPLSRGRRWRRCRVGRPTRRLRSGLGDGYSGGAVILLTKLLSRRRGGISSGVPSLVSSSALCDGAVPATATA